MFFTNAYAETAPVAAQPNMLTSMLPFVVIFAIFYFLVIRPQRNAEKKRQEELKKLEPGTLVVTNSGIYGKIVALRDKDMDLEVSKNSIIRILRTSIAHPAETTTEVKK